MKLFKVVPGAIYTDGKKERRVHSRLGAILHRKWNENKKDIHSAGEEKGYFDDAKILFAQQQIAAGLAIGNPVKGSWKDLRKCSVIYVEEGQTEPITVTIQAFAEWARSRIA